MIKDILTLINKIYYSNLSFFINSCYFWNFYQYQRLMKTQITAKLYGINNEDAKASLHVKKVIL
jgi:hypothetical protein